MITGKGVQTSDEEPELMHQSNEGDTQTLHTLARLVHLHHANASPSGALEARGRAEAAAASSSAGAAAGQSMGE